MIPPLIVIAILLSFSLQAEAESTAEKYQRPGPTDQQPTPVGIG